LEVEETVAVLDEAWMLQGEACKQCHNEPEAGLTLEAAVSYCESQCISILDASSAGYTLDHSLPL
jgi:hypothetical protein